MPKIDLKLVYKRLLCQDVYYLIFQTSRLVNFVPGQFMSLIIKDKVIRPYSIVESKTLPTRFFEDIRTPHQENGYISFLISTKPGGKASQFIQKSKINSKIQSVGPAGRLKLLASTRPKVFVATGTGIASFISMIEESIKVFPESPITLYYAAYDKSLCCANIFINKIQADNPNAKIKTINVLFDDLGIANNIDLFHGDITEVIMKSHQEIQLCDYYLCGNPNMVDATYSRLQESGVNEEKIVIEKYG